LFPPEKLNGKVKLSEIIEIESHSITATTIPKAITAIKQ
jgi:hypothetical protein